MRAHPRSFLDVSTSVSASKRGASHEGACAGWAHQRGHVFRVRHAFSFRQCQLVIQLVIPPIFSIKAPDGTTAVQRVDEADLYLDAKRQYKRGPAKAAI